MIPKVVNGRQLLVGVGLVLLISACIAVWVIKGYDKVIAMDENVRAQWANVESQLQRRYDLIPALVNTVEAYAHHEREVFIRIIEARAAYMESVSSQERMKVTEKVETELAKVLLLRERYPLLKSDETFLKLMDSLEGTENRIAFARLKYNHAVLVLNTYRRTLYGKIFARFAGVASVQYYAIPLAEKDTPQVNFPGFTQ